MQFGSCLLEFDVMESSHFMVQNTKQGCGDDDADQKRLGRGTAEEKLAEFIISWRAKVGGAGILTNLAPLPMSRNDVADYVGLSDMPRWPDEVCSWG